MSRSPIALRRHRGLTLIELMIVLAVVAILVKIAMPGYQEHIRKASRQAAQAQLIELSAVQEKIFLNSNAYSSSVSAAYTGASTGGLGASTGKTSDNRYTLSVSVSGTSYTLTATPVASSTQAADGALTINAAGSRTWGSKTW